jgi:hypothetical protein
MPNLGAWITASLYVSAAYSCRTTVSCVKPASREARIWISIAVLSIVLGVGELLNLQALITNFGRTLAQQEGWYAQRQPVQATFIGISSAVTAVLVVVLLLFARRTSFQCRVASTSAALIVCYTLVRASSLHDVDVILSRSVFKLHLNRIPELAGIAVVLLASLSRLTSKDRRLG